MSQPNPFYRNVRVLAWLAQIAFALGVVGLGWLLLTTMLGNLQKQGIPISFAFLPQPAGFGISEGLPFQPSQSYLTAFGVGVVNTLIVIALSTAATKTLIRLTMESAWGEIRSKFAIIDGTFCGQLPSNPAAWRYSPRERLSASNVAYSPDRKPRTCSTMRWPKPRSV